MRYALLASLLPVTTACASAPKEPCEFSVWVKVMSSEAADEQCRIAGVKWTDSGKAITDRTRILGCAGHGYIITNGTESNLGHEMKHQVDRNCK